LRTLLVSPLARRDVFDLARWSEVQFGRRARDRYLALIERTFVDLRTDPARPGVETRSELPPDIRIYHLRHGRSKFARNQRVNKPRHFVVFRMMSEAVEVVRVLYDAMDLPEHL